MLLLSVRCCSAGIRQPFHPSASVPSQQRNHSLVGAVFRDVRPTFLGDGYSFPSKFIPKPNIEASFTSFFCTLPSLSLPFSFTAWQTVSKEVLRGDSKGKVCSVRVCALMSSRAGLESRRAQKKGQNGSRPLPLLLLSWRWGEADRGSTLKRLNPPNRPRALSIFRS